MVTITIGSAGSKPSSSTSSKASCLADTRTWISDSITFARQFILHPRTLGTPFVCSPFVAKEILKYVDGEEKAPARNYLEVGAGTGAMTRYFVRKLRPEDHLHLVEINEALCNVLRKNFGHLPNVSIHNQAIQDWTPPDNMKFDAIVTTIPFNSLPSADVLKTIFKSSVDLIKPNGVISSVEYVGTSTLSKTFKCGDAKKKFNEIFAVKNDFFKKHSFDRRIVCANFPPARVTHCRISTSK